MNKLLPSRFTVSIPVKPYVKRFLDINFGLPVDFTQNAHSHRHFQSLFKNPNTSQDKKYPHHICTYTDIVEVVISEHDFYRYGWELTKTNTIAFGKFYEAFAPNLYFGSIYILLPIYSFSLYLHFNFFNYRNR